MSESGQTDGAETLAEKAGETVRAVKQSATDAAERQKERGAQQLAGVAGAVHSAADELGQQMPAAADYVHDVASSIDRVAAGLRDRNLSDLLEDVRRVAREQPLAVFGGALVAGFAISRFLKSAQNETSYSEASHSGRKEV